MLLLIYGLRGYQIFYDENSFYPVTVTVYGSHEDQNMIEQYLINKDQGKPITLKTLLDKKRIDKQMLNVKKLYFEITFPAANNTVTLYADDLNPDSKISVVNAPFGHDQALGALKIVCGGKPEFYPDKEAYDYVAKRARMLQNKPSTKQPHGCLSK